MINPRMSEDRNLHDIREFHRLTSDLCLAILLWFHPRNDGGLVGFDWTSTRGLEEASDKVSIRTSSLKEVSLSPELVRSISVIAI